MSFERNDRLSTHTTCGHPFAQAPRDGMPPGGAVRSIELFEGVEKC